MNCFARALNLKLKKDNETGMVLFLPPIMLWIACKVYIQRKERKCISQTDLTLLLKMLILVYIPTSPMTHCSLLVLEQFLRFLGKFLRLLHLHWVWRALKKTSPCLSPHSPPSIPILTHTHTGQLATNIGQ